MNRPDTCPSCVANVEPPHAVQGTPTRFIAAYRCSDCGWEWTTSWRED